jgi:hypothetical protein
MTFTKIFSAFCLLFLLASCSEFYQKKQITRRFASAIKSDAFIKTFKLDEGVFSVQVKWDYDSYNSNSDVLAGQIEWTPDKKAKRCDKLSMIQIAKVTQTNDADYKWTMGQSNRNLFMTKSNSTNLQVVPGYFIDIDAHNCLVNTTCSPYYIDSYGQGTNSRDGYIQGKQRASVLISDYPYGWTEFEKIQLETCAVCRDDSSVRACITWGGKWPIDQEREILSSVASEIPTATFSEALKIFKKFYKL